MDILSKLKDVRFWLNQINCDAVSGMNANFLNKAKNDLDLVIVDGEEKLMKKLYPRDNNDWTEKGLRI